MGRPERGTSRSTIDRVKCPTFWLSFTTTWTEATATRPPLSVACRRTSYSPLSSRVGSRLPRTAFCAVARRRRIGPHVVAGAAVLEVPAEQRLAGHAAQHVDRRADALSLGGRREGNGGRRALRRPGLDSDHHVVRGGERTVRRRQPQDVHAGRVERNVGRCRRRVGEGGHAGSGELGPGHGDGAARQAVVGHRAGEHGIVVGQCQLLIQARAHHRRPVPGIHRHRDGVARGQDGVRGRQEQLVLAVDRKRDGRRGKARVAERHRAGPARDRPGDGDAATGGQAIVSNRAGKCRADRRDRLIDAGVDHRRLVDRVDANKDVVVRGQGSIAGGQSQHVVAVDVERDRRGRRGGIGEGRSSRPAHDGPRLRQGAALGQAVVGDAAGEARGQRAHHLVRPRVDDRRLVHGVHRDHHVVAARKSAVARREAEDVRPGRAELCRGGRRRRDCRRSRDPAPGACSKPW